MSRLLALAAALVVCSLSICCLSAQENRPAGAAPADGGLSGLRGGLAAPAAEKTEAAAPPQAGGLRRVKTLFQAAQARGLAPAAVEEVDFEAVLRQPTKFEFAETCLSDAVEFLSNQHHIDIHIDNKGLADAAVDPSSPITCSLRKPITLQSALHLILEEFDLTFTIQDEVMKITSKEKADEILTTKVYPVGDLIPRQRSWGPLMNLISSTIQPDSWEDNGGPGSIQPYATGGLLIVSQKRDVHSEIHDLFTKMRAELAKGKDACPAGKEPSTVVYHLGGASAAQTAEAIKKLVVPTSWDGQGGEGQLCVVSRKGFNDLADDVLVIRQTDDVHVQIQDLIGEFERDFFGKGHVGGMSGIMGNAPAAPAQAAPAAAPAQ